MLILCSHVNLLKVRDKNTATLLKLDFLLYDHRYLVLTVLSVMSP